MLALHLTTEPELRREEAAGEYRMSSHGLRLEEAGFIHLCTAAQLPGVARRFYAGVTDPLVVLVVDLQACAEAGSPVRWEPAPDADELFPHVYGPLPWAAITARLPARFEGGELRVEGLPT